ncbi:MAG: integrase family protein, partial [Lacunisphaera sp.]|nr:integrase family protein [Lacunisphaera sp.]
MCASVHRKPRSPYWMAKFTDATGRRLMRSTKQEDRKKAAKIAEEWEAAARKARRGELTQAAATKILRDMMEDTTGDELRAPSIADTLNG